MLLFNLAYFVFMWHGNIARFLQVARYFAALKSAVAREARTLSLGQCAAGRARAHRQACDRICLLI